MTSVGRFHLDLVQWQTLQNFFSGSIIWLDPFQMSLVAWRNLQDLLSPKISWTIPALPSNLNSCGLGTSGPARLSVWLATFLMSWEHWSILNALPFERILTLHLFALPCVSISFLPFSWLNSHGNDEIDFIISWYVSAMVHVCALSFQLYFSTSANKALD